MVKPYYSADGITIYHGDCRDIQPAVAADVLIADPPYGTGYYRADTAVFGGTMLADWIDRFATVAVFGYAERLVAACISANAVPAEWVTWWPTNGACRGLNLRGLRREAEHIAVFGVHHLNRLRQPRSATSRRVYKANYRRKDGSTTGRGLDTNGDLETRGVGDVWTDSAPGLAFLSRLRLHPNQKPEPVLARMVEGLTDTGQSVLDPFMGSGTTLLAAKALSRKAIGIEIEEHNCEIAARRLEQQSLAAA